MRRRKRKKNDGQKQLHIYNPLTILCCFKVAVCWRTAANHVESCQSAAVVKEWYDTTSDGDVGGRRGEGGVQVACDFWAGQIVAYNASILLQGRRRVPHQCDIV